MLINNNNNIFQMNWEMQEFIFETTLKKPISLISF